jgi:hypothetical protein
VTDYVAQNTDPLDDAAQRVGIPELCGRKGFLKMIARKNNSPASANHTCSFDPLKVLVGWTNPFFGS